MDRSPTFAGEASSLQSTFPSGPNHFLLKKYHLFSWVFTAAHCTPLGPVYRIVAGILLQNDQGVPGQQIIDVVEIFNHPGYPG